MRYYRHIPSYIQNQIVSKFGGVIKPDDEYKVLAIGTPAEVMPGDASIMNTAVKLEIGDYVATVHYNRQDLQTFWTSMAKPAFLARKLIIRDPKVTCVHDILPSINAYTGFEFDTSDVHNDPIVDGTYSQFVIRVTPTNLWFTGQLIIPLQFPLVIRETVPVQRVPNPIVPAPLGFAIDNTGRFNASLLTYDVNYGELDTDTLAKIAITSEYGWWTSPGNISDVDGAALAAVLAKNDGLPWVYSNNTVRPFNIYNSRVLYNGPVGDFAVQMTAGIADAYGISLRKLRMPREDQRFVLALAISPNVATAKSTNLTSDLILIHYGGPALPVLVDKPPVHHWPLNGNRRNIGTDPKHPEWTIRGRFGLHDNSDEHSFLPDGMVDGGGGTSHMGVELPVDRDFTISFDLCQHTSAAVHPYGTFQLWHHYGNPDTTKDAGRIMVHGTGQLFLAGTYELARGSAAPAPSGWPHWHTYTVTRRGNWYIMYVDGEFYSIARGNHQNTAIINALYATAGYAPMIKDFRYYDYALSGDQVRRRNAASLSGVDYPEDTELPEPLCRWPLNNNLVNLGKDKTPLANVFSFRKVGDGKDRYWACALAGQFAYLGVGTIMRADVDFTLCWDHFHSDSSLGYYGFLGGPANNNTGHPIKYYGTTPFCENGGGDYSTADPVQCATLARSRIQLRKRGGYMAFYVNGQHLKSQLWTNNAFTAFSHFGQYAEVMRTSVSFRNLTYYDVALSDDQLWLDANKDW